MSEFKKININLKNKPIGIELNDGDLAQVAGGATHEGTRYCPDCESYVSATIYDDGSAKCNVCNRTL